MTTVKFEDVRNMGNPEDNPYLARSHVRTISYNTDKTKETITWNCWPREYQYNYNSGSNTYYGYHTGGTPKELGGILRYSGSTPKENEKGSGYYVLPTTTRYTRRDVFEGIRISEIRWKSYSKGTSSSSVSWKKRKYEDISDYDDAKISMSASKNDIIFEIEVDYELCTMGLPHRKVPFFYYSRYGSTYMCNGSYFTDSDPGKEPGRSYSKVSNAWNFVSFEWGDPRATTSKNKTKVGWAYKNAKSNDGLFDSERTSWNDTKSFEYQTKKPYLDGEGWTSDTPYSPEYARKSCYWTYKRTYKDKITSKGVLEKPIQLAAPNMPVITVIKNHCDLDLRGEVGTVKVKYTHPNKDEGFITLYSVQQNFIPGSGGKYGLVIGPVYSNIPVNDGETYSFNVEFNNFQFKRSQEIRYFVKASVDDPNYANKSVSTVTNLTGQPGSQSIIDAWNACAKGHYFNDEPPAPTIELEESLDRTKTAKVYWDAVTDPDNDSKKYSIYIQRQNEDDNTVSDIFYGGMVGRIAYENEISDITSTSYNIDMTPYNYAESLKVWIKSYDQYINSYYYSSSPIIIKKTKASTVIISTSQITSTAKNPINGKAMIDGTKGRISVTYKHEKGVTGTVTIDAYQSNSTKTTGTFFKTIKTLTFDSTMINANSLSYTQTFDIDFISLGFTRSRDIRYFAKSVDADGNVSYLKDVITWDDCTYGHHFNDEPEPCAPWIENLNTIRQDEIAKVRWNVPKDTDGDTSLYYIVYLKCENDTKNIKSKEFFGPYIKGVQKYCKEFITTNNYIDIDISQYNDDKLSVWIESYDYYFNNYYYSGLVLPFENTGVAPNVPRIIVYQAHGEEGELSIQYSHNTGRSGYMNLYAICEYTNKSRRIFTIFKDKPISNGDTLEYTSYFYNLFGNTSSDRSCNIRYFATARTQGFNSDSASTVPLTWTPTTSMYDSWTGGHYYNEEPPKPTLTLDNAKSNLYKNAYFTWNNIVDPDGDVVKYQIYLRAKSASYDYKKQYTYFYGVNRKEDLMMYCDLIAETTNNFLNIDLTHYKTYSEEFDIWVRPWDCYENSYYYNSNVVNFKKLEYSKPIVQLTVQEVHGESGTLTIKYTHPDALLTGDAAIDRGSTNGKVWLYAYVEGNDSNPVNITNLINSDGSKEPAIFTHNQTKTITINFENHIGCSRSKEISYFAIARDVNDEPGNYSTNYAFNSVPASERSFGHYYNGIPLAPSPHNGLPDSDEDKKVYDFNYTNIEWDSTPDPDEDIVDYYLYIKTPTLMNEPIITENFYFNNKVIQRSYNRKYKIEPIYDSVTDVFQHYQISIFKSGSYIKLYDKDTLKFRLDYIEGTTQWPESVGNNNIGIYSYWIESRDRYNNSYYNSTDIIIRNRKRHEKPNEVIISCTPCHGETGDLTIKYTHPENLDSKIYLYAFVDKNTTPILIETFDMTFTKDQLDEYAKTLTPISIEMKYTVNFNNYSKLIRSNNISYYAIAIDTLVGYKSNDTPLEEIIYSKKATGHYYNEEPPCTTPFLLKDIADKFDLSNISYEDTPYNTVTLAWKKVVDPDKDSVNYNFYMNGPSEKLESKSKTFYGDYDTNLNKGEFNYSLESSENSSINLDSDAIDLSTISNLNLKQYAEGDMTYNYYKQITPSTINESNIIIDKDTREEYIYYKFDISTFDENGNVYIWIETDDSYENSYYRSGKILILKRGHKASIVDAAWPRNYSIVYSKTPRIVIKLAEDDLEQEVMIFWRDTVYSNKNPEHLQCFSCGPKITKDENDNIDQYIIFRPPTSQTPTHNSKILYSVKVNNTCTDSDTRWFEYTYNSFGYNFSDTKFVPVKYAHINEIRPCVQKLMDAYGKDYLVEQDFVIKNKSIAKGSIVDNEDYNEIANPLRSLNNWINTVDNSLNIDDNTNVVIKNDFDLIEYEEQADSDYMTSDFKEWKILLYLLQNM